MTWMNTCHVAESDSRRVRETIAKIYIRKARPAAFLCIPSAGTLNVYMCTFMDHVGLLRNVRNSRRARPGRTLGHVDSAYSLPHLQLRFLAVLRLSANGMIS